MSTHTQNTHTHRGKSLYYDFELTTETERKIKKTNSIGELKQILLKKLPMY
jgi:hypothetical protein